MGNLALAKASEIFKSTAARQDGERVVEIPLAELYPPEFHPFHVLDDESMARLAKNIKRYGVREPGLARPREGGGYELVAGNRRKRACELAGLAAMPAVIREMDDDSAVITMVGSNLEQRERILFSEKAWAYRMKLEALDHNGIKGDMLSVEKLAEQTGESKKEPRPEAVSGRQSHGIRSGFSVCICQFVACGCFPFSLHFGLLAAARRCLG
jgi:ParB family chromosome partitioning protein